MTSRSEPLGARSELEEPTRAALAGTRFARLDWVVEAGSTNTLLLDAATRGAPDGTVLAADHQTAGRGTKGRTWFDPPGGSLLASVLVRPRLAVDRVHRITMAFGLAAVDAVHALTGRTVGLKWPNDVFATVDGIDGPVERKLAGILAESRLEGARVDAVVVGMGMNVNWPAEVPTDLGERAVSLDRLAGRPLDRGELLAVLLRRFAVRLDELASDEDNDGTVLLDAYRAASCTIGRRVRLELPGGGAPLEGRAVDVTAEGHLMVDLDGEVRTFSSADVSHLRATG
ncbi:MAG: biotin--[acetyl-CoA-carboxylase] ligase [Actinobacteria bacterium]|nr:biotin--[acetyl-CoA-carboxylase] ligase [Actinomycetota bacterium]